MAEKTDELDAILERRKPSKEQEDFSELEALDPAFRRPIPTFEQNKPIGPAQAALPEAYQMVRKALVGEGPIPKGYGELAGLGVGAAAGTLEQGRNIMNLLPMFRAASEAAPSPTGSAYEKWLKNFAGIERTGPGGVPEAAQTYQRIKTHGKGAGEKMFQRYGTQPLDIARYAEQAGEAEKARRMAGLGQMAEKTTRGLGYIPGLSLLAGTSGAADLVEAMRRMEKGDYPGAAIKGIGGLGTMASLIPTPLTRLGGGALGLLSMPLDALYQGLMTRPESAEYTAP